MELADDRELVAKVRRTRRRTVTGGPDAHKPFDLVEPRDAGELYAAVHRHRVLVLALSASWVRSDPGEASARWRHVRRLEEFVSYKAAYCMVRGPGDPERAVSEFGSWPVSGSCTTTDDPRVLPLHVFDHSQAWLALGTPSGAATFAAVHGQPRRRVDPAGRTWCPARRGHGNDGLTVSGLPLPTGFHWDVQRGRAVERLVTCHEVWRLGHRGSYANVYPDAYVRVGARYGRRVWRA
jgi:hypothetical protein